MGRATCRLSVFLQRSFWINDLVQISVESQQLACKILAPRRLLMVVSCPNSEIAVVTERDQTTTFQQPVLICSRNS